MVNQVKIIECPRDAMQGLHQFIPTEVKTAYINKLLQVGFDTIDFGSFVSTKAIPQLRDTSEVLKGLKLENTKSKLLAIIANLRGGEEAVQFDEITYLGFPFSISETFQLRNTNSTIEKSLGTVQALQDLCLKNKKQLVVYISMAFGNPYSDPWNADIAISWIKKIASADIKIIALADTVGIASPEDVSYLFNHVIPEFNSVEIGAHLHCTPANWQEKVNAAFNAGCRRFDTAIKGYGGCPMANDELVGNLATENLLQYLDQQNIKTGINLAEFKSSLDEANMVFNSTYAT